MSPPTFRRIVTSHHPSDTTGDNVTYHDDTLPLHPVLPGLHISPLYSSPGLPTYNPHIVSTEHISGAASNVKGVVLPGGTDAQVTHYAPRASVPLHRTSSVDYNVIVQGSIFLIVPDGQGGEKREEVKAGELVVQTGTLHGWEAGEEGARVVTVVVEAKKVEVGGKELEDVDFK
ncbi:hypothetical protein L202_06264 [Cryptococcus amylolentus CBS 6039]|uniref:Cupin 2 conserved barrel domain-containing protein n=2 Tax=Cryptococcus amylolentus TaxID=104669 RepID=A0A1E3HFF3_9TREE|nr:hypothetical protein L202_06264 [Cryptococcus amylolentus CBS 6039]ODN75044.1 hypothetical protein L202_06264 [Cryptococcus amylolentus CBS 6039]ODO02848.1 hypothetical protein I350_05689 [Cryptococcus amylolentus CBS 6273]